MESLKGLLAKKDLALYLPRLEGKKKKKVKTNLKKACQGKKKKASIKAQPLC